MKAGVPVRFVSERLGHATPLHVDTYEYVLPGMQAQAARTFEALVSPSATPALTLHRPGPAKQRSKPLHDGGKPRADEVSLLSFIGRGRFPCRVLRLG